MVVVGQPGPGRFRPVRARGGTWQVGNGHSRAQRCVFGVPRPVQGSTTPQWGVYFFLILVLVGGASLLAAAAAAG